MHCTYIKYFNSVCTAESYTRRYTQNIIRRRFKDFTLRTNLHTELYYKSHESFKISNPRVFAVVILRVFNNTCTYTHEELMFLKTDGRNQGRYILLCCDVQLTNNYARFLRYNFYFPNRIFTYKRVNKLALLDFNFTT